MGDRLNKFDRIVIIKESGNECMELHYTVLYETLKFFVKSFKNFLKAHECYGEGPRALVGLEAVISIQEHQGCLPMAQIILCACAVTSVMSNSA